jgi:hypothetical protein
MMIFKGFDAASLSTAQAMAGGGSRPCRKHLQGMELGSEPQKLATAILRGEGHLAPEFFHDLVRLADANRRTRLRHVTVPACRGPRQSGLLRNDSKRQREP